MSIPNIEDIEIKDNPNGFTASFHDSQFEMLAKWIANPKQRWRNHIWAEMRYQKWYQNSPQKNIWKRYFK